MSVMSWHRKTEGSVVEIATLAEVKAAAAVDTVDEDSLLEAYRLGVRGLLERQIGHSIANDVYEVSFEDWRNNDELFIPVFPVGSVEDSDGTSLSAVDRGGDKKFIQVTDSLKDSYPDKLVVDVTLAWDFSADDTVTPALVGKHADLKYLYLLLCSHAITVRDIVLPDELSGNRNALPLRICRRYQW